MGDLGVGVVEQYDITVLKTLRGRGSVILETEQGCKRLMEYKGTRTRLEYMAGLTEYIYDHGLKQVDTILKNRDGMLLTSDECGDKYIITDWYYGNECDVRSKNNIKETARLLAVLHSITESGFADSEKAAGLTIPATDDLLENYDRHNMELKRALKYIRNRKHKTQFEYGVLKNLEEYLRFGINARESLMASKYKYMEETARKKGSICHGNYNYHNVIFTKNKIAVVNFERSGTGVLIKDLYLFLRKVMEKYDWDESVGHEILNSYNKVRSIPEEEYRLLKIMLTYPEKFWKLVNHYYNGNKSWIPDKSLEKLQTVCHQQKKKEDFIGGM